MINKVLLADDEDRMRKLLSDFLKREGYSILEARNGREALELFENDEEISLLILDVMMPETLRNSLQASYFELYLHNRL